MRRCRTPDVPSLWQGIVVALSFALGAGALFAALTVYVTPVAALRLLTIALGGSYVVYLLAHASKPGRIAIAALWAIGTAVSAWLVESLPVLVCVQMLSIWVVRCLCFHTTVIAMLADLGLSALALGGAVWAAASTASVALAVWCLFLVQALFVALPRGTPDAPSAASDDCFERARRSARAALHRIETGH